MIKVSAVQEPLAITNCDSKVSFPKAEAIDYAFIFEKLKSEYSVLQAPIETDFRELVKFRSGIDKHSHLIHTYPAKLLLNIPYFFLRCSSIISKPGLVLDPFCGSGTVLLESIIAGHDSVGADANPLARLIAKVKTTQLGHLKIKNATAKIVAHVNDGRRKSKYSPQEILDWDYWYSPEAKNKLERIGSAILEIEDSNVRDFFKVCFSNCVRKVSYADQNVAVPVKLNPQRYSKGTELNKKTIKRIKQVQEIDVLDSFLKIVNSNSKRITSLKSVTNLGKAKRILDDARNLSALENCSVDLIITSPPYAGAQKYIRSSSLSLGWLKLCPELGLRDLEKKNIGREHYSKNEYANFSEVKITEAEAILKQVWAKNPLRAHIAGNYLIEMRAAIEECHRVLKTGHHFVLVIGNNVVCGYDFETQKYISEICRQTGFMIELVLRDNIKSRGLMTKRNKTASIITCEWIIVLKKV